VLKKGNTEKKVHKVYRLEGGEKGRKGEPSSIRRAKKGGGKKKTKAGEGEDLV